MANCCDCRDPPGENHCGSEVFRGLGLASTTCSAIISRELRCPWEEARGRQVRRGRKRGGGGLWCQSQFAVMPGRVCPLSITAALRAHSSAEGKRETRFATQTEDTSYRNTIGYSLGQCDSILLHSNLYSQHSICTFTLVYCLKTRIMPLFLFRRCS